MILLVADGKIIRRDPVGTPVYVSDGVTINIIDVPIAISSASTLPSLIVSSSIVQSGTVDIDATIPSLVVSSTIVQSGVVDIDATIPSLVVSAMVFELGMVNIATTLPSLVVSGEIEVPIVVDVAATLPMIFGVQVIGEIDSSLPVITGDMSALVPAIGTIDSELIAISGDMEASEEPIFLPMIDGDFGGYQATYIDSELPALAGSISAYSGDPQTLEGSLPVLGFGSEWTARVSNVLEGELPLFESSAFTVRTTPIGNMVATFPSLAGNLWPGLVIDTEFPLFSGEWSGSLPIVGNIESELPISFSGSLETGAILSSALPMLSFYGSGIVEVSGELSATMPTISGSISANVIVVGTLSAAWPCIAGTVTAVLDEVGNVSGRLPSLNGSFSGIVEASATMSAAFPMLSGKYSALPTYPVELSAPMPLIDGHMICYASFDDTTLEFERHSAGF